ncbi:hypothetical protein B0T24DRAFT_430505 [Lasiosphaeria ovina]|uniref:Uncharacterized protein n=1 Tax=Lasiosphaeria ovina TaxID=92902 RepID=A0AAE0JWE1_9PEZI|nr:hypothetical protein B0T24DRAFT_430505 [Lasiosphaeria ovina]
MVKLTPCGTRKPDTVEARPPPAAGQMNESRAQLKARPVLVGQAFLQLRGGDETWNRNHGRELHPRFGVRCGGGEQLRRCDDFKVGEIITPPFHSGGQYHVGMGGLRIPTRFPSSLVAASNVSKLSCSVHGDRLLEVRAGKQTASLLHRVTFSFNARVLPAPSVIARLTLQAGRLNEDRQCRNGSILISAAGGPFAARLLWDDDVGSSPI